MSNYHPDLMAIAYCFNPACPETPYAPEQVYCPHCGLALLLKDRYQVIRLLGKGRFSRTLLAGDRVHSPEIICSSLPPLSPPQYVVIKQFWSEQKVDESLIQTRLRAYREAYWLQRLADHPDLPKLLDQFEQDGVVYLVQRYIPGSNLADYTTNHGLLPIHVIWQLLNDLLSLLQFIHSHHIIHREIKPENIILTPQSSFALVDFGAAQHLQEPSLETIVGSPEYAAPEQIRGQAVPASDLYSLGVTCIHLLTGMSPFQLFDAVQHRWAWQEYWRPSLSNPAAGLPLAQFLNHLIAPTLSDRWATAAEAMTHLPHSPADTSPSPSVPPPSRWNCYATLVGHDGLFASVNAVAIAPDGLLVASASDDKTIRLWELQTGMQQAVLSGHTQAVKTVVFAPQTLSALLVSGSADRTIRIWDRQQQDVRLLTAHTGAIESLAFSPDGQWLASGSSDKTIRLWQTSTWEPGTVLTKHRLAVKAIAFHPTQPLLVSASADATLQVWNWQTAQVMHTLTAHTRTVSAIAFTPDGTLLASGGADNQICLWDTTVWQCDRILSGHPWDVSTLTFSPDGSLLFSGSWDKTVKVWQVGQGQECDQLQGHIDSVTSMAIGSSGTHLATGSKDRTIKLWKA